MMHSTGSMTIRLLLREEYQKHKQREKLQQQPFKQSTKPSLPDLPSKTMVISVVEEFYLTDQKPLVMEEKVLTPEERDWNKWKETRQMISELRRKHSLVCRRKTLLLSCKESLEQRRCRSCQLPVEGSYSVEVLHNGQVALIEDVGQVMHLTVEFMGDKWLRCLYCEVILEEEILQWDWDKWWKELKKSTKDRKAMKGGQEHRKPAFKTWLKAHRKGRSSLQLLESRLDKYRKD